MGVTIKPIKVAVIGAGNMALEHIRAFQSMDDVVITGIFSRTKERAQQLADTYHIPIVCDDITELFEKTLADLVIVTVFETAMLDVAMECLDFPWMILLEKPPGYCVTQTEEIHRKAIDVKRQVFVALNRRFLSSTQAVLSSLSSDNTKRFIHIQDQQSLETARYLKHPAVVVDHWMYANSIHLVDYAYALGRGNVSTVNTLNTWDPEKLPTLLAHIRFDSGDEVLYEGIWHGPGPWAVAVTTEEIRWEMRPLEIAVKQLAGTRERIEMPMSDWDKTYKPGFRLQAESVVKAVRGEQTAIPSLAEGLKSMRLIQAIYGK